MSKPYDATSKDLLEADPAGWVAFLGHPVAPELVRVVDAGASTVTTDSDKVIRVDEPDPWLLHLEFQASWAADLPTRLLRYNAILQHRHGLPVATVVVLLRREQNIPALTGRWEVKSPVSRPWAFEYEVVRVWERPPADFLGGPLGLIPFAPLADVDAADLPGVADRMRARIVAEADRPMARRLWAATYILAGLRYDEAVVARLIDKGVTEMEESVTYQAIVRKGLNEGLRRGREEGRAEGLDEGLRRGILAGRAAGQIEGRLEGHVVADRVTILRLGLKKFGPPSPEVDAALAAITKPEKLEALIDRVLDATSWDDLLRLP